MLYLKDINLPRPDKYDTCMLIAFLQQLQTFGGFYDENLEFLRLERVHVSVSSRRLCPRVTTLSPSMRCTKGGGAARVCMHTNVVYVTWVTRGLSKPPLYMYCLLSACTSARPG